MSPTEFDLRAALQDGEGDGPDPDAVISKALSYRRQRRVRIAGGLSAAAVVVGLGGAISLIDWSPNGQVSADRAVTSPAASLSHTKLNPGAGPSSHGGQTDGGGGFRAPRPTMAPTRSTLTVAVTPPLDPVEPSCPSTSAAKIPSVSSYTATRPLLPASTRVVIVCSYGTLVDPVEPSGTTIAGRRARTMVASLNAADTVRPTACPDHRAADDRRFVLIGLDTEETASEPVTVDVSRNPCGTTAYNGRSVRYGWAPPADVATYFEP